MVNRDNYYSQNTLNSIFLASQLLPVLPIQITLQFDLKHKPRILNQNNDRPPVNKRQHSQKLCSNEY